LIRWSSVLIGGDKVIAGMVLANVFSLIAALVLLDLVSKRFGASAGWWTVVLILTFPGSLFFQFIYSESLFFLLAMLVVLGLERKLFSVAFVAALLLPLTRAVGFLCVVPIAFHIFTRHFDSLARRLGKFEWVSWIAFPRMEGQKWEPANEGNQFMLAAAPLYGWAIYLSLMWFWTGDPFEGFTAQRHWGVQSISNLFALPHFITALLTPTTWHGWTGSVLDRSAFMMIVCSLPLLWRLDKHLFLWVIVLGVVPAVSGTFTSFTRFASMVFPTFLAMGIWLSNPNRYIIRAVVLASFAIVHLLLLYRFIFFEWAG
jgi:hypothetical protein